MSSAAARKSFSDLGAAALLIVASSSRDPDLAPFVGPIHLGASLLILPAEGEPHLSYATPMERDEAASTGLALLTPEALGLRELWQARPGAEDALAAWVEAALKHLGVAPGRIAVAGHPAGGTLHGALDRLAKLGWVAVGGNELSRRLRKVKDSRQRMAARRAAAGAATALRRVAEQLAAATASGRELQLGGEPLTVGRLRLEVARTLAAFELEQPEGNIVAPAGEGAVPHSAGRSERVLCPGETLIVDLFPQGWLFADVTRTFCVPPIPEAIAKMHDDVREALRRAQTKLTPEAVRSGLRAYSLQDAVCSFFKAQGYPTVLHDPGTTRGYVHNLGHGVGFELHEFPSFKRDAGEEGRIEAGDLLTLEPGLYEPELGYAVRLEDLILVGEDGVEQLTPLPYELDPRAW